MTRRRYLQHLEEVYKALAKLERDAFYSPEITEQAAIDAREWLIVAQRAINAAHIIVER